MTDCYQCIEFGYDPYCWCQDYEPPVHGTKHLTRRYQRGEHVMNSNEAKVMRRIQSETGMTEAEVREHKKYRVMLSEAQTAEGPGQSDGEREAKRLLKQVTRELKLAKQHPDVVAAAMELAEKYPTTFYGRYRGYDMPHLMKELLERN